MSRADGKCTLVDGMEKKGVWQAVIPDAEMPMNEKAAAACPVKIIRLVR